MEVSSPPPPDGVMLHTSDNAFNHKVNVMIERKRLEVDLALAHYIKIKEESSILFDWSSSIVECSPILLQAIEGLLQETFLSRLLLS